MKEATNAIRAAARVLSAVTRDYKQLLGEPGLNDEATEEYQVALIAALLLWIGRNKKLKLDDEFAVTAALAELQLALEELGLSQLPEAFVLGSGTSAVQLGEVIELGGAINTNQQFIEGSLIPYMQEELALAEPGMTLGELAAKRQFAWETRTGLYAGTYWTAIWAGLGASLINRLLQNTQPVRRLLDPQAAHCGTCPGKAIEYSSWNEMLAFTGGLPADGSDDCHCVTTPDSRILTERGWIPIRGVIVGDRVFTHRGRWRTVLETIISVARPTHRQAWLLAPSGEWIGCTTDHRWLTSEGWRRTDEIKRRRLSVYNWEYAQRSMSLRKREGRSRSGVPELRNVAQGQSTMARSSTAEAHSVGYSRGRSQAQMETRRFNSQALQDRTATRWPSIHMVLGRRSKTDSISLSMDLDTGQWFDPRRNDPASYQSRSDRRPPRESSTYDEFGSQKTSSASEQADRAPMRYLRQGILEDTAQETPQQILFSGLLSRASSPDQSSGRASLPELRSALLRSRSQGTPTKVLLPKMHLGSIPLYDLRVDEDHSFIVEGLISHNSNCRCQLEVFQAGEWISAGI